MKLTNPEVRIETTNHCPANCIMCPHDTMTRSLGVMDMDIFKKVVDDAVTYNIDSIFLGGFGEPLVDVLLEKRIEYIKSKNPDIWVNFISNGLLWTEKRARGLIEAGLDEVRFSVYGTTKEVYEKVHQNMDYDKVMANIHRVLDLKKSYNSNMQVLVFWLMLEENQHQYEDWKEYWIPRADAVEAWKPHNWSDAFRYREVPDKKTTCGRPKTGPLQVQWDGTVIPCCWDYDGKMILGDLREQTIEEVMKGEKYEDLRDAHAKGEFDRYPFCNQCDQLYKRSDVLIFSNRGEGTIEEKVGRSNSNLFKIK
ncbi:MAG: SPASM domain-containing protein [Acidobacteria bacterium]|nr:SPASM domain-containing protein [Acidobacteriota bacterium]